MTLPPLPLTLRLQRRIQTLERELAALIARPLRTEGPPAIVKRAHTRRRHALPAALQDQLRQDQATAPPLTALQQELLDWSRSLQPRREGEGTGALTR